MNPFSAPALPTSRPMNPFGSAAPAFESAAPASKLIDPSPDSQQHGWSLTSWPARNSDPWATPSRQQGGQYGESGQPWVNPTSLQPSPNNLNQTSSGQMGMSSIKLTPTSSGQGQASLSGCPAPWPSQADFGNRQDAPLRAWPPEPTTKVQSAWPSESSVGGQRSPSASWPPAPWPSSPVAWPSSEVAQPGNAGIEQGSSTSWQTQPWPSSGAVWPSGNGQQQELQTTPWSTEPWPSTTDAWPETDAKVKHKHRHKHRKSSTSPKPSVTRKQRASSPPPAHEFGRDLLRFGLGVESSNDASPSASRKGILVRVIRARNLRNVEVFGRRMDPYVEVKFDSFKAQTSVCMDGHTEPSWDQALRLPLRTADDLLGEQVAFSVFDKNRYMTDALIGSGSELYGGRQETEDRVSRAVPLYSRNGDDAGVLDITLEFLDQEPPDSDYSVDCFHKPQSYLKPQNQCQQSSGSTYNHNSSNDSYNYQQQSYGAGGGGGGDPETTLIVGGVIIGVGLAAAGAGYAAHKLRRRSDGTNRW